MIVLAVNVGSSSIKLSLYDVDAGSRYDGGVPPAPLWEMTHDSPGEDLGAVLASAWASGITPIRNASEIRAVGHRVVNGGRELRESVVITPQVRDAIVRAGADAPAHNSLEVAAIDAAASALGPGIPQVAVFDTTFHRTLEPAAFTYAGPYEWLGMGIRRRGFHGISHEYAARRAAFMLGRSDPAFRVVTCHLGSGCSLAAVRGGRSVDTTMGFTPLDGIPMATRSGSIDPGILLHLLRAGATVESLDDVLNHRSGLAGLSGLSGDMRELLSAIDAGHERARLAYDVYVHSIRKGIAAMTASMGGLDCIVFTGGVGENVPRVRADVSAPLGYLGVHLDARLNDSAGADRAVSREGAAVAVLAVRAQENMLVAFEAARVARAVC